MAAAADIHAQHAGGKPRGRRFFGLMLGSMGIVFGDIGTSPIYGFKTALTQAARGHVGQAEVFGIVSLTLWALIMVVTVKYVAFMMRHDNRGEGGILSLMALAQAALGHRTRVIVVLGVLGASLFYGDAIITPAISVMSAVEGLKTVPGLASAITPSVEIALASCILVALFLVQSRGTAKVAAWFGPICLLWFVTIAALGLLHIPQTPSILLCFNPLYGLTFLAHHGVIGLFVMGSVSLTITGAEALYADMGHFGRSPIRAAWMFVIFPALALNYLGQGAFALHEMAGHGASASPSQDWFFLMAPTAARIPMVILANAATIIASQAVISGAYSLSNSAMQMGLLPRLELKRTSSTQAGQIYVPTVNFALMVGVILLVGIFKNSDALADAYGFAVTGTMCVDTLLAAVVVHQLWKWSLLRTGLIVAPLLTVDLSFFGANSLKLLSGGYVPLAIAGGMAMLMGAWMRGTAVLGEKLRSDRIPLADFLASIERRPRFQVSGIAIYFTGDPNVTPGALLHNLKHNGVLHQKNIILHAHTTDEPRVADERRASVEAVGDLFTRVELAYGYMETPDVPAALAKLSIPGVSFDTADTSYFLGRRTIVSTHPRGLKHFEDLLFIAMSRNSADPSEVFCIPPGRVVEMGVQVAV
ncbi:MAG TPA: potassium transporter Kup [Caulobacteraceae bacterium]|jgi:KUP system potassium uptake protein|nr:potassium transporter Kup [Caulobacteraceae bacterium]